MFSLTELNGENDFYQVWHENKNKIIPPPMKKTHIINTNSPRPPKNKTPNKQTKQTNEQKLWVLFYINCTETCTV